MPVVSVGEISIIDVHDGLSYDIYTSSPITTKEAPNAISSAQYSTVILQGKKRVGITTTNFGWITITLAGGSESVRYDTATASKVLNPNALGEATSYTVKLYDAATGGNLVDTKIIGVVYSQNLTGSTNVGIAMDDAGHKRITWNDGDGNWNFRAGNFRDSGATKYIKGLTSGDSGAAAITFNTDDTNGEIWFKVAPIGTPGNTVSWFSSVRITTTGIHSNADTIFFKSQDTNTTYGYFNSTGLNINKQLISYLATGIKPIDVTSTTVCTNLNADMVDGKHVGTSGSAIPLMDGTNTWTGVQTWQNGAKLGSGVSSGRFLNVDSSGRATVRYDDNGNNLGLTFQNLDPSSTTGHGISMIWQFCNNANQSAIGAGGINIVKAQQWTSTASTQNSVMNFSIAKNGSVANVGMFSSAGFVIGTGALGSAPTDSFLWLPSCAGTPGTPTATPYTDAAAVVIDSVNSKLFVRVGTTWKSVNLT